MTVLFGFSYNGGCDKRACSLWHLISWWRQFPWLFYVTFYITIEGFPILASYIFGGAITMFISCVSYHGGGSSYDYSMTFLISWRSSFCLFCGFSYMVKAVPVLNVLCDFSYHGGGSHDYSIAEQFLHQFFVVFHIIFYMAETLFPWLFYVASHIMVEAVPMIVLHSF